MPPPARSVPVDERRRLVATALDVGNPARHLRDLPEQADPRAECPIEIDLEEIRSYEGNPRRSVNAKFEDIKASIRASGIRSPLSVTRRPGEKHFIVEAGGNTRLEAIRQLWTETGEARFRRVTVLFRPWKSETHVLAAHLSENEQRGGMTFWDKACGFMRLKAQIEAERGHALTLRQFGETLRTVGLPVNLATLAHYAFTTDRLRTLGEGIPAFTVIHVRILQPRLNQLRRYAQTHAGLSEDALYAEVLEPVFVGIVIRTRGRVEFSAEEVLRVSEVALARRLGVTPEVLAGDLLSLERTRSAEEPPDPEPDAVHWNDVDDEAEASEVERHRPAAAGTANADSATVATRTNSRAGLSGLRSRVEDLFETAGLSTSVRVSEDDTLTVNWFGGSDGSASEVEGTSRKVRGLLRVVADAIGQGGCAADEDGLPLQSDLADEISHPALLQWLMDTSDPVAEAGWQVLRAARDFSTARRESDTPGDD